MGFAGPVNYFSDCIGLLRFYGLPKNGSQRPLFCLLSRSEPPTTTAVSSPLSYVVLNNSPRNHEVRLTLPAFVSVFWLNSLHDSFCLNIDSFITSNNLDYEIFMRSIRIGFLFLVSSFIRKWLMNIIAFVEKNRSRFV